MGSIRYIKLSVYKHLANLIMNISPVFIELCGPLIIFNAMSMATIESENCLSSFKVSKRLIAFKHSIDVVKSLQQNKFRLNYFICSYIINYIKLYQSYYLSLHMKPPGALYSCRICCLRLDLFSGNCECMKATRARHITRHLQFLNDYKNYLK